MKIQIGDEVLTEHIRVVVRLDYRTEPQVKKRFLKGKNGTEEAEELREQQVALWRNVPLQGIIVEDVDMSLEVYMVKEAGKNRDYEVFFAPVILTLRAESIEDLIPVLMNNEFRRIEFLNPESMHIHRLDMERLLYKLNQAFQQEIRKIETYYQD
ncbi:MAG: hypothetical protein LBT32_02145 [Peptococcaceae bacterium]|nr:hypothetical protein [Peptococcaceae bacterium]